MIRGVGSRVWRTRLVTLVHPHEKLLQDRGLIARPDYSTSQRYRLRHQADFEELRRQAHDAGPGSTEWQMYLSALQNGDDENLPSVEMLGRLPQPAEDQEANAALAQSQATQRWVTTHPLLSQVCGLDGVTPLSQLSPAEAHDAVAAFAARGYRTQAAELSRALDESTSTNIGISYVEPDDNGHLTYEVPQDFSSSQSTPDAYSSWRQANMSRGTGLAALAISNNSAEAALFSGVSPDGMSYHAADDVGRMEQD